MDGTSVLSLEASGASLADPFETHTAKVPGLHLHWENDNCKLCDSPEYGIR